MSGARRRNGARHGAGVVVFAMLFAAGLAACGIDAEVVSSGTGVQSVTTTAASVSTAPIETSTTKPTDFTLPTISTGDPNTTQSTRPETTEPPATTTPTTDVGKKVTPNGVSEGSLADELSRTVGLPKPQSKCVSHAMFKDLTGSQIDAIYSANDVGELDPTLVVTFTGIVTRCVTGG